MELGAEKVLFGLQISKRYCSQSWIKMMGLFGCLMMIL